ncbi:uncharacterized protein EV422DRAFT_312288 [Fimicolochytrium jonesii]|uniref:uncharacterized protein n=1 Tax=Fimicolochytrium jonesii TaxID=1396493 RepID=UPI0022FF0E61|nr:uncharacterized protein EV422DRAFT_312288 [Fimicolochytrium jonesii]KAI8824232.1 hypothetical protein EV422DRAFT_312288 [Fimicolochytrium jonesii]
MAHLALFPAKLRWSWLGWFLLGVDCGQPAGWIPTSKQTQKDSKVCANYDTNTCRNCSANRDNSRRLNFNASGFNRHNSHGALCDPLSRSTPSRGLFWSLGN